MRRLAALVTALIAVGGFALAASPAGAAAHRPGARAAAPTVVSRVRPVTATGALRSGYTVTHRLTGASCQSGSEATGNAYRCFAGNAVIDPCWVTSNTAFVDCLAAPYSHKVTRLHVTKGYDNTGGFGSPASLPWGLQVGGKRMVLLQGATSTVNGMRINYEVHGFSVVLVGPVDKSSSPWTIRKGKRTHGVYRIVGRVDIATAWFGQRSHKG